MLSVKASVASCCLPWRLCLNSSGRKCCVLLLSTNCSTRGFHQSSQPRKSKRIDIDVFNEEMFPTRRAQIGFEKELTLNDRIRSARVARKHRYREVLTQQFSRLMYLVLTECINRPNGVLKPLIISLRDLGYAPALSNDSTADGGEEEPVLMPGVDLDNVVEIQLQTVGFEVTGVTMPSHRQHAVVWYKYNSRCRFPAGVDCLKRVLAHYRDTLRGLLAARVNLKRTPRLVFKYSADGDTDELADYYKHKFESALTQLRSDYYDFDSLDEINIENYMPFDTGNEGMAKGIDERAMNDRMYYALLERMYGDTRLHLDKNETQPKSYKSGSGLMKRVEKRNFWSFFDENAVDANSRLAIDTCTGKLKRNVAMHKLTPKEKAIVLRQNRLHKLEKSRDKAKIVTQLIAAMDVDEAENETMRQRIGAKSTNRGRRHRRIAGKKFASGSLSGSHKVARKSRQMNASEKKQIADTLLRHSPKGARIGDIQLTSDSPALSFAEGSDEPVLSQTDVFLKAKDSEDTMLVGHHSDYELVGFEMD